MGVPPYNQGRLYWWQEDSLVKEYNQRIEFMNKTGRMM